MPLLERVELVLGYIGLKEAVVEWAGQHPLNVIVELSRKKPPISREFTKNVKFFVNDSNVVLRILPAVGFINTPNIGSIGPAVGCTQSAMTFPDRS